MNRRHFLLTTLAAPLIAGPALAAGPAIEVFKSPTCGCCSAWIEHALRAGFDVTAQNLDQDSLWTLKLRAGITPELASCHTAFVDGYVVEGHVPVPDLERLLAERPTARGLAVPGMPIGSPGMEAGDRKEPFETLLVLPDGATRVFERHG